VSNLPQLIIPWFYRQLRFSSGEAQRLGSMLDHFESSGTELTLVLELNSHDHLWIRPGAVTDAYGLFIVDDRGGVAEVATHFHRPSHDPTRVKNEWAAIILLARGEAALDPSDYAEGRDRADLERAWGMGVFEAAERIAAGNSTPTVEATCASCRLRQPLTFAKRTCTMCNAVMPAYRNLAQEERRAGAWGGPFT